MGSRRRNEREYPNWEELPAGGRRYWNERPGKDFGSCRYVKYVDATETTVRLVQEIYDNDGTLIETHQKYPIDTGHRIVRR